MTDLQKKLLKNSLLTGFLLLISFVILLFGVESSPLYPLNEWTDPNCFYTVGKALANGIVPYRDIYEQKGPYVYFLHALCYLIDSDGFFGVWLMEVAACFTSLLFISKILKLYGITDFKRVAPVCVLIALSVYFSFAMSTGDSVEEFCSPLLLGIIYISVKHMREENGKYSVGNYLYIGIAAGIIFWSKFTIIGFFIAWYVFFLFRTVRRKQFSEIWKSVVFILIGVVIATLPCLIYFSVNGAVKDWLKVYLYDNIFLYQDKGNIFYRLFMPLLNILGTLGANIQYNAFVILGIVLFARKNSFAGKEEKAFLLIVPILATILFFIGGRGYRYYGLPLYIFAVFGYVGLLCGDYKFLKKKLCKILVPVVSLCFCLVFFCINGNVNYIFKKKEDTVQYKFAKIINEKENATLLNYGFLDGGFYLAADILPEFKYFCQLNIPLDEMYEETERYIEEGIPDFVVMKVWYLNENELQSDKYREVARESAKFRENEVVYVLYEKI